MADIIDALFGGPSWLERANQQRQQSLANYLQGGVPAMMANTQGIAELAGGFGGTTKFVGQDSGKKLAKWMSEVGAKPRDIFETKDVTLPGGKILPNRQLRKTVYDLDDGSTVEIKTDVSGDPLGGSNSLVHTVVPYGSSKGP